VSRNIKSLGMPMSDPTIKISFRLPRELVNRIDGYARALSDVVPGVPFNRTEAIKTLIERGLEKGT
jgi:hypothetical protein